MTRSNFWSASFGSALSPWKKMVPISTLLVVMGLFALAFSAADAKGSPIVLGVEDSVNGFSGTLPGLDVSVFVESREIYDSLDPISDSLYSPSYPFTQISGATWTHVNKYSYIPFGSGESTATFYFQQAPGSSGPLQWEILQPDGVTPSDLISYDGLQTMTFQPVPEPSTFALMGVGAIGLVGWAWRRRRS